MTHYLKHRPHLLILKARLASVLYKCTQHSALQVFNNGISCVISPTCCFMTFFAIGTAPLLVLAEKAEEMAISYWGERQAAIFSYNYTRIHKMVSKVHLNDDFCEKETGINLKLAECMQKTCVDLNPYALKCDFYYWWISHMMSNKQEHKVPPQVRFLMN